MSNLNPQQFGGVPIEVVETAREMSHAIHDEQHRTPDDWVALSMTGKLPAGRTPDEHYPGCLSNCGEVSEALAPHGLAMDQGTYYGPDSSMTSHAWNRHSSGAIVDATADQFGDQDPVRVVPHWDARQQWYSSEIRDDEGEYSTNRPWGPGHADFDAQHPRRS